MNHVFVIAAYGNSPYLRECLESLTAQSVPSPIFITTSTPSRFLTEIGGEFGIPIMPTGAPASIAADWNFALTATSANDSSLVTVVHQDDVYAAHYAERIKLAFANHPNAIIAFCGNTEHTPTGLRKANLNLLIKRRLCTWTFGSNPMIEDVARRRHLLRWGNPICCPSVVFNRQLIPQFRFSESFGINLDWDAWERLAKARGGFLYLPEPMVSHRVHAATETSAGLADNRRSHEDLQMFRRFWHPAMATGLHALYRLSYLANRT